MITQDMIERFFLKMVEELRKDNIPIMNHYHLNFRNYPYEEELEKEKEKEIIEDEEYYNEEENI